MSNRTDELEDTETVEAAGTVGAAAKPRTRAEKLEAKAARLRELEQRRAERAADREAETGRGSKGLLVAVSVLAVLVLTLGTLVAILVPTWLHQKHVNAARASALAAARTYAVDFGSYDYRHLDADFARVANHLTADFRNTYLADSTRLRPAIVQYQGRSTAIVQGLAVGTVTETRAEVFVMLDQNVTTAQSSTPRTDRNRLQMTLVRHGGHWRISRLQLK
ncbi:MAG TPA: hypothetical protein VGN18_20615 [Jatrophihabitans sp.]|jgi:Mce-associated membrane protein|uniref:hypothetical protein n=1 Tax=Jatrophihabitans sp. TaxID=1932789 RepID=UPI002DFF47C0|nr:hypothetical protein [Jatrophihabitans sp.]